MVPEVNTVKLFGLSIGGSSWACRVYAWTEERAREAGREDIKYVVRYTPGHTSGQCLSISVYVVENVVCICDRSIDRGWIRMA